MRSRMAMTLCSAMMVMVVLVSGCARRGGGTETYKIGALISVTGAASSLGLRERQTLEMMAKQANEAGGIKGPDGKLHPVELVMYDTGSDETKAVMTAKKLINEDKVSVILGPTTSGESLAILDTVQRSEIPMVSLATNAGIVEPVEERKWVFKVTWNDSLILGKMAKYFSETGVETTGFLNISNAYGETGREAFEAQAPAYGLRIVAWEKLNPGDTDMTAQLTKIKGLDPDALVIYSIVPELAIAAKNAYDLGFDVPVVCMGGSTHPSFIELAGKDAAEGVLNFGGKYSFADQLPDSDPQKAEINRYKEQFRKEYGEEPDHFGGHAWDAWKAAVYAIEKAGGDRAAIRDALEQTDFVGVSGIYRMSPTDHAGMALESIVPGQLVNGEWVLMPE
jgi:branched-chain amino acid transport system substrate-binding protein